MLENRLTSCVKPHPGIPIPDRMWRLSQPKMPISFIPFLTELRVATALWVPRLAFPVLSPSIPTIQDLARCCVRLERPDASGKRRVVFGNSQLSITDL